MSFFENSLVGKRTDDVCVDSEVTYFILSDGTQISVRGLVVVEPRNDSNVFDKVGRAVKS